MSRQHKRAKLSPAEKKRRAVRNRRRGRNSATKRAERELALRESRTYNRSMRRIREVMRGGR